MAKSNEISKEVKRRRTFAIISHPDAGKTTLTEKLLLFGGAIRLAGAVKGRKFKKFAVSDWMEIEKQRGISVTSSVMNFDYNGYRVNILDTPGHQDFSEDTYRTLAAADSAVMLIDGAKGVEEQTKKLFHVCRMRGIPIFTFVNKMDRVCRNPFDLMADLEATLGIRSCPMNWPIGVDGNFKGVYNRKLAQIELFEAGGHGQKVIQSSFGSAKDEKYREILGDELYNRLVEEIEMLDVAGDKFDMEKVLSGELTPMYFGSAMTNFGVKPFLEEFIDLAPYPGNKKCDKGIIEADDDKFSGFVFKIQANMNSSHRDRIAFMRICSGKFEKGIEVNNPKMTKGIKLSQPQQFFGQERTIVEEAYAGDIIGVFDPGNFSIGDTLYQGKEGFKFEGIPMFPAEHFANVRTNDTMKRKQFLKGIHQIVAEGAIQIFKQPNIGTETFTVGVVGVLQFEVLEHRMRSEYGAEIIIDRLPFTLARWVGKKVLTRDMLRFLDSVALVEDQEQRQVLLCSDEWTFNSIRDKNKDAEFYDISPSN